MRAPVQSGREIGGGCDEAGEGERRGQGDGGERAGGDALATTVVARPHAPLVAGWRRELPDALPANLLAAGLVGALLGALPRCGQASGAVCVSRQVGGKACPIRQLAENEAPPAKIILCGTEQLWLEASKVFADCHLWQHGNCRNLPRLPAWWLSLRLFVSHPPFSASVSSPSLFLSFLVHSISPPLHSSSSCIASCHDSFPKYVLAGDWQMPHHSLQRKFLLSLYSLCNHSLHISAYHSEVSFKLRLAHGI